MSGRNYLLDTNIIVDLFQGNEKTRHQIEEVKETIISVITLGELYYGAENSQRKEKHLKELIKFNKICKVIEIDNQIAKRYGMIKKELKKIGKPIPENDIWIAATTIEHKLTIITKDRHFSLIDGIKLMLLE